MSGEEERFLRMLFYERGGDFYEYIDEDGIRKAAIKTRLTDKNASAKERWEVNINWKVLAKWLGDK